MQTSTNRKRIEWIDALRGFTMILVVFSHVETFGLDIHSNGDGINDFFRLFRMPLFFFVSGFIAYRMNEVWDWNHYKGSMLKKLKVQLIPMLFFGLLFAFTVFPYRYEVLTEKPIPTFFNSPDKIGYWFTEVLLEMFVIYYTVSFLMRKRTLRSRQALLVFIAMGGFALSLLGTSTYTNNRFCNWFCIHHLLLYFQFFVFGHLFSCYRDTCYRWLHNQYVMGAVLLLFGGLYIAYRQIHGITGNTLAQGATKLAAEAIHYLGIVTVVAVFKHYEHFFSSNTRIGRGLQYIGQRTLDVYLLHYFLIPAIPMMGMFFSTTHNMVLETTAVVLLSLLVIGFCLIISNIIRTSPLLAHWILGVKRNNDPK